MATAPTLFLLVIAMVLGLAACTSVRPEGPPVSRSPVPAAPVPRAAEGPPQAKPSGKDLTEAFECRDSYESSDFIVTRARLGDTAASLATRYLNDASRAWRIEEYTGVSAFSEGQEVVIPKHDWNPAGVYPWGYQLVPVLVYHNISREQKGHVTVSPSKFEEQMRYLQAEDFHTVTLRDFFDYVAGHRQLPRKSVLLTFDDGWRSFEQFARPVLKQLGFTATLFVYTDFIGAGREALSWNDLKGLIDEGFDVQAHGKTHEDLRRRGGESDADYTKRMEAELGLPLALFRKHLGRGSPTMAFPFGSADEELLSQMVRYGYVLGFTVRRQANPSFVFLLKTNRSMIYGNMTLTEFAKNLNVFQDENLTRSADLTEGPRESARVTASPSAKTTPIQRALSVCERLVDAHNERSDSLERQGRLRQALDERVIALTINPRNRTAQAERTRLEAKIKARVSDLTAEGRELLARGIQGEGRQRFLAALVLDPTNRTAFETVQNQVHEVTFIVHTVRPRDTLASLADLYYGDRSRAEVIAETNHLTLNARLAAGQTLQIPEIPGVPFLTQ